MSASTKLVDEERVLKFVDGDRESLAELAQAFVSSVPAELGRARAAAVAQDLKQLVFSVHKLKSSVTIFHDGPATVRLGELERKAMAGDGSTVAASLAEIDATITELIEHVRGYVNKP